MIQKKIEINDQIALNKVCEQFSSNSWLAVDTEFIREKTYFSNLCLIQICNGEIAVTIDPLNIEDLSPLKVLFFDPNIEKVFHSSRQDLEIFYFLWNAVPFPIFDTQISAALLGYGDQIGYANLVEKLTNIHLKKGYTRANWQDRPLSVEMLNYAFDDVIYLADIYLMMKKTLEERQQLDWLAADFEYLSDSKSYQIIPEKAWRKVKGRQRLSDIQRACLQQCAIWRETEAIKKNLPKSWLISNHLLLAVATEMPNNKERLKQILKGVSNRYIDIIFDLIEKTKTLNKQDYPLETNYQKPNACEQQQVKKLRQYLIQLQKEKGFSLSIIPSKKNLLYFVRGQTNLNFLMGWKNKMMGELLVLKLNEISSINC